MHDMPKPSPPIRNGKGLLKNKPKGKPKGPSNVPIQNSLFSTVGLTIIVSLGIIVVCFLYGWVFGYYVGISVK